MKESLYTWDRITVTAGGMSWDEWRSPSGSMKIIIASNMYKLLSPVKLEGMHEQPGIDDRPVPLLFSKYFLTLDAAIKFAEDH